LDCDAEKGLASRPPSVGRLSMQAILLLVLSNMSGGPRHYSSGPVPSLWTPPTPEETMKLVEMKMCSLPANEHLYFILIYTFSAYTRRSTNRMHEGTSTIWMILSMDVENLQHIFLYKLIIQIIIGGK
jgi:hypothetical protein